MQDKNYRTPDNEKDNNALTIDADTRKLFFDNVELSQLDPEEKKRALSLLKNYNNSVLNAIRNILKLQEEDKPFIEEELKNPKYHGFTIDNLDELDVILYLALVSDARLKRLDAEKRPHLQLSERGADILDLPLDKINSNLWNTLKTDKNGQLKFVFDNNKTEIEFNTGTKKGQDAIVTCSLDFEALEGLEGVKISKSLTPFDKRLCIVCDALMQKNEYTTIQQIYYSMGHHGTAGKSDKEKIYNGLIKLRSTNLFLSNERERQVYPKYPAFEYNGAMLPNEIIMGCVVNGQQADLVHWLRKSAPLSDFARSHKQVTTFDARLLAAPLNQSDSTINLQDYLIVQISHLKNKKNNKIPDKILFTTLYEECDIKTKKQRFDVKKKLEKILSHFQTLAFIKSYSVDDDAINFTF